MKNRDHRLRTVALVISLVLIALLTIAPKVQAATVFHVDFDFYYDDLSLAGMARLQFDAVDLGAWHNFEDLTGASFHLMVVGKAWQFPGDPRESWYTLHTDELNFGDAEQLPRLRVVTVPQPAPDPPTYRVEFEGDSWGAVLRTYGQAWADRSYFEQRPGGWWCPGDTDKWVEYWVYYTEHFAAYENGTWHTVIVADLHYRFEDTLWEWEWCGDCLEPGEQGVGERVDIGGMYTAAVWFDDPAPFGEPVPVPAPILLLGTGLLGTIGFRRKCKKTDM